MHPWSVVQWRLDHMQHGTMKSWEMPSKQEENLNGNGVGVNNNLIMPHTRKQCAEVAKQLNRCKTHYYSNRVEECHNDQKSVFKITDTLLVNQHQSKLPTYMYDDETLLANNLCNFFHVKIETIRANFNSEDLDIQQETLTDMKFRKFRPATLDEIRALILSWHNSSCLLDPVPTWLLKECIDDLQ